MATRMLLSTAGMGFGFRYAINSVLLNERGQRFVASEFLLGVEPRQSGTLDKPGFVLDCSGRTRTTLSAPAAKAAKCQLTKRAVPGPQPYSTWIMMATWM